MGLVSKIKAVKNFASNPAKATGAAAGAAVTAAGHPYAAVAVAKGTEAAVNKGISMAKDPEVQAKVKEAAGSAVSAIKTRIDHLHHGIGEARGESTNG